MGTEPDILDAYVASGDVKLVFWPVLNHGNPSVYSTLTAVCAGQQDPMLFWALHTELFNRLTELYGADRDYYVNLAVTAGAEQAAFEACYDDPDSVAQVTELDTIRRDRGIFSQPTFDVNGRILVGRQPFDVFAGVIDDALP